MEEKHIISEEVDSRHYTADACILWCFDDRFSGLLERLVLARGLSHIDLVKVAGGAKGLGSPDDEAERAYLVGQIKKSIELHGAPEVVLMVHTDCGAYGSPKFQAKEEERKFFTGELEKAEKALKDSLGEKAAPVHITKYFADFHGIVEV